ncbi:MAG: hypothetical protein J1E36_05260, partial [Eubacterium sp.]|nr:hypothetical protein [Eubacterium sp.]
MKRFFSLALSLIMFVSAAFGTLMSAYAGDKIFGVDISVHDGVVNFTDLQKSGKEFVMIRIGYSQTLDKNFWDNVKKACANKMNFGVYHYSYATSIAKAKLEAEFVIDTLAELEEKGYADYFTLPVAYDLEDSTVASCGKTQVTNQITTFLDMIKNSGYVPMVYANRNWFLNYINLDTVVSKQYKIWYAYWPSSTPDFSSPREIGNTGVKADMWQYIDGENSSDGYDQNVIYDPDELVKPLVCKGNNHTWDDGKITKKATKSANGTKTYTCTKCGETKTETIAK